MRYASDQRIQHLIHDRRKTSGNNRPTKSSRYVGSAMATCKTKLYVCRSLHWSSIAQNNLTPAIFVFFTKTTSNLPSRKYALLER